MQKCVEENAHAALDQEDYLRRYGALLERYEAVKSGLARISEQRQERGVKRGSVLRFPDTLNRSDLLTDFDEALWHAVVETVTVRSEQDIVFAFKDGMELRWTIL